MLGISPWLTSAVFPWTFEYCTRCYSIETFFFLLLIRVLRLAAHSNSLNFYLSCLCLLTDCQTSPPNFPKVQTGCQMKWHHRLACLVLLSPSYLSITFQAFSIRKYPSWKAVSLLGTFLLKSHKVWNHFSHLYCESRTWFQLFIVAALVSSV